MDVRTILVPLDGSGVAEAALTPAVKLAREAGAKLILLRAAEAHPGPMGDVVEAQVHVMREAEEYLAAVRARAIRLGFASTRCTSCNAFVAV